MKKMYYFLLSALLCTACSKESEIEPAKFEALYTLPQGNHSYDAKILDFYNTYGCYILYKFTNKDFQWNFNTNTMFYGEPADENFVEPALTALDNYLFQFYPSAFLKKALPYKIMLASRIRTVSAPGPPPILLDNYVNSCSNYSHFAFGRAGSTLPTLTAAQLKVMKAELHREFWKQAVAYRKIELPPLFVAATNYSTVTNVLPIRRANGVFTVPSTGSGGLTVYTDFVDYMYNIALQTPQEWEQTVFTATNDTGGKFRLKYNIIINYFKETYGIDLLAISKI